MGDEKRQQAGEGGAVDDFEQKVDAHITELGRRLMGPHFEPTSGEPGRWVSLNCTSCLATGDNPCICPEQDQRRDLVRREGEVSVLLAEASVDVSTAVAGAERAAARMEAMPGLEAQAKALRATIAKFVSVEAELEQLRKDVLA